MITVHLSQLRFFAYHGVYPAEALTGNDFEIDVDVAYDETGMDLKDIDSMINYEKLFAIVHDRMQINTPLLETIAEDIIASVRELYAYVSSVTITIMKLNAPISKLRGRVGVTLSKTF